MNVIQIHLTVRRTPNHMLLSWRFPLVTVSAILNRQEWKRFQVAVKTQTSFENQNMRLDWLTVEDRWVWQSSGLRVYLPHTALEALDAPAPEPQPEPDIVWN